MNHQELMDRITSTYVLGINIRIAKALHEVAELHKPKQDPNFVSATICSNCGVVDYPCQTIQAIQSWIYPPKLSTEVIHKHEQPVDNFSTRRSDQDF